MTVPLLLVAPGYNDGGESEASSFEPRKLSAGAGAGPDAKSEDGKSLVQAEEVEERAQSVSSTEPEPQWLN